MYCIQGPSEIDKGKYINTPEANPASMSGHGLSKNDTAIPIVPI